MKYRYVLACGLAAAALLAPFSVSAAVSSEATPTKASATPAPESAPKLSTEASTKAAPEIPAEAAPATPASPESVPAASATESTAEKPALGKGLATFALGMSEETVKALGAQPTDNPEMLQLPIRWADADWNCVVQLDGGKVVAVLLHGELSDALLEQVFADLRGRGDMPVTVQPAMGHPDLYQLSAQGKSDEECWLAMRKRLGVFSNATEGACSVLFTSEGFFRDLAATVKEPAREHDILAGHASDVIYAVNMDKSENKLTYLVAPWGYMSR